MYSKRDVGAWTLDSTLGAEPTFKERERGRDVTSAGRQMSLKYFRSRLGFQLGSCQYTDVF